MMALPGSLLVDVFETGVVLVDELSSTWPGSGAALYTLSNDPGFSFKYFFYFINTKSLA